MRRLDVAEVVLDASALLAFLNDEPGGDVARDRIPVAVISALNLTEVVGKLADAGMPEPVVRDALSGLDLDVLPFDSDQAYSAGMLHPSTRGIGLSLGDRACLGLALKLDLPALTADRAWTDLRIGARVMLIR